MPPEKEGFQSDDNLEDTLNAAIDELGGWDDDAAPAPAAAAEPAEDADDDGPADPVLAPEPAEAKEPAKEAAEDEADDLPQAVEGDIDSPKHWPDALKARLAGIKDPDARKLMLDYNAHMNERWRQEKTVLNQQAQVGSAALEALAPHIEELRIGGLTPGQAINNLVRAEAFLRAKPVDYLLWVAKSKGIDLHRLANGDTSTADDDDMTDPAIKELMKSVGAIQAELSGRNQREQQTSQQRMQQDNVATLEKMAGEKNADGSARYPYFLDVADLMAQKVGEIVKSGRPLSTQDLPAIYNEVRHQNPMVREALIQDEIKRRTGKTADTARQKAEAAQKARTIVPSARTSEKPKIAEPAGHLQDVERDVLAAFASLS